MRKVALITERLEAVNDEGIFGFLHQLVSYLRSTGQLLVLFERGGRDESRSFHRVLMGKGLVTSALRRELESFSADLIIYCPSASTTLNALFRHRRLQRAMQGTPCALLSMQHRSYSGIKAHVARYLKPWRIVVLSRRAEETYRALGFNVLKVPAGVDLDTFQPVSRARSMELRERLKLDRKGRVILHVGHLANNRGLERMKEVARLPGTQVVVVVSTAYSADSFLKRDLEENGVRVLREYVPKIHEYYQTSDLYIFPVRDSMGSIEFPLSVLEAMACNLRVLSTPFGALPDYFSRVPGLRFLEEEEGLAQAAEEVFGEEPDTRRLVERLSWKLVIGNLLEELMAAAK